jgi:CrcB protein
LRAPTGDAVRQRAIAEDRQGQGSTYHARSARRRRSVTAMTVLLVGLGGFLGAILRFLVDGAISGATGGSFPWGTLVINVTGSLALGVLFAAATERGFLPPEIRPPVMIGFIGAYTTFSTLMLESGRLIEDGALVAAAVNIGGSVALGIVGLFVGLALGRLV